MTNSLCYVCHETPNSFIIVDQVLVCCVKCANKEGYIND
jgi:hypothetical protein